jgi:hypothetical protein
MILLEAGEVVTAAACKYLRHEVCWIPVANFPVHETSDNIVLWLRQKITGRVGRGGTQGAGDAGGGASSYDQELKSLNEQWLQMRFTTQGKPPSLFMHTTFLWLENSVKTFNLPIVLKLIVYNES